jgi:hypothetical protein
MSTDSRAECFVCRGPSDSRLRRFQRWKGELCEDCFRIAKRRFNAARGRGRNRIVPIPGRQEWIEALRSAWDEREKCFRCAISGVRLTSTDPSSPLYATLDHSDPSSDGAEWLVVAAAINDIKSDLAIDELRRVLPLLSGLVTGNAKPEDRDRLESILKRCVIGDGLKRCRTLIASVAQSRNLRLLRALDPTLALSNPEMTKRSRRTAIRILRRG